MFNTQTLFIVGAGASCEARLPTGTQLAEEIAAGLGFEFNHDYDARVVKGDKRLFECLQHFVSSETHQGSKGSPQPYFLAAQQIARGVRKVKSIDNFVDIHRNNRAIAGVAKLTIAYLILQAERRSRLYVDTTRSREILPHEATAETWYPVFAELAFRGVTISELDTVFDKVEIICFNYDRCIERYMAFHIDDVYGIGLDKAREVVAKLKIVRPYGWVGPLQSVAYGYDPSVREVSTISRSIRTYTERMDDEGARQLLVGMVDRSETAVFLGFGFHGQNMELLRAAEKSRRSIFATACGIPEPQIDLTRQQLEVLRPGAAPVVRDMECRRFLAEFGPLMGVA